MTKFPESFDDAANSLAAFKAVASQLVTLFENDGVSYPQDADVQPLYDQLATHAAKAPFPSMVPEFKALLAEVNSPFGEKIAALATSLAYELKPAHVQIINKLHLADISAHVPGYGPEIPAASVIRADVKAQLDSAVATGFNYVTTTILDGIKDSGGFPDLSDPGREMIAEFMEASVNSFLKDEEPDAHGAARWLNRAFYFTDTPLPHDPFPEISERLYDHLPYAQKVEVLDSKISVVQDMPRGATVSGLLARFGQISDDFYQEDGETLKEATAFLPDPNAGRQMGFGNEFK